MDLLFSLFITNLADWLQRCPRSFSRFSLSTCMSLAFKFFFLTIVWIESLIRSHGLKLPKSIWHLMGPLLQVPIVPQFCTWAHPGTLCSQSPFVPEVLCSQSYVCKVLCC